MNDRHTHGHTSGKLTEIDHVGIAVHDLDAVVKWYEQMFGATVAHRERIESDGVEEALIKVADSYIQLLTPYTDDYEVFSNGFCGSISSTSIGSHEALNRSASAGVPTM